MSKEYQVMNVIDTNPLIFHAKYLVSCDETELALKVLECIPGYYRDNVPGEIKALKEQILSKFWDMYDYMKDTQEEPHDDEYCKGFTRSTMRGMVLYETIFNLNKQGKIPHIVDFGSGDFCFAIGMKLLGLEFTYHPLNVNAKALEMAKQRLGPWMSVIPKQDNAHRIFVAYEIIEHLHNDRQLSEIKNKYIMHADTVLLSTPKYTFGAGTIDWETKGIHHLRTYTPIEFQRRAIELFPNYSFSFYDDVVMVLAGQRV